MNENGERLSRLPNPAEHGVIAIRFLDSIVPEKSGLKRITYGAHWNYPYGDVKKLYPLLWDSIGHWIMWDAW